MSDTLTTRLLAEIERREAEHRAFVPMRDIVDRRRDAEPLAYLAALRKIVELHALRTPAEGDDCCEICEYGWADEDWPCPTIASVASALGVEA